MREEETTLDVELADRVMKAARACGLDAQIEAQATRWLIRHGVRDGNDIERDAIAGCALDALVIKAQRRTDVFRAEPRIEFALRRVNARRLVDESNRERDRRIVRTLSTELARPADRRDRLAATDYRELLEQARRKMSLANANRVSMTLSNQVGAAEAVLIRDALGTTEESERAEARSHASRNAMHQANHKAMKSFRRLCEKLASCLLTSFVPAAMAVVLAARGDACHSIETTSPFSSVRGTRDLRVVPAPTQKMTRGTIMVRGDLLQGLERDDGGRTHRAE